METKFYDYPIPIKIAKTLGWFMALLLVGFTLLSIGLVLRECVQNRYGLAEVMEASPMILSLLGGVLVPLGVIHGFSNLGVNEDGLQVQFMWWYITVPWAEIISVEEGYFAMVRSTCVKARRITWFHYFYGLSHPAVMISSRIDNYAELLREIKKHISRQ